MHTAKIMRAIERMTDLLTMPVRIGVLTPFTSCMIAKVTIAHLSACRFVLREQPEQLKVARERIRVAMGALEIFAEVWPKGKATVSEVKTIARELLSLGSPGSSGGSNGNANGYATRKTSFNTSPTSNMAASAAMKITSPVSAMAAGIRAVTVDGREMDIMQQQQQQQPQQQQLGSCPQQQEDVITAQILNDDDMAVQADYFTGLHQHAATTGPYFGYPNATTIVSPPGSSSGLALGLFCDDMGVAGDFSFDIGGVQY